MSINVPTPRNAKSSLTATITLQFPEGNVNEEAVRKLFNDFINKHWNTANAKVDFERTITQSVPLGTSN